MRDPREQQLLHRDLAHYYDLIYSYKDYRNEVKRIVELIGQFKRSDGNDLLEVACGTGRHLVYLKEQFCCVGVDLNQGVLNVARERLPGIELRQADMVELDLGRRFDVIVCLFSSIGYVQTYEHLQRTLDGFARHLKPGGVALVEPWLTAETYKISGAYVSTYHGANVTIAQMSVCSALGDLSVLDYHYLVAEVGKEVRYFWDRHELGLFDTQRTLDIMRTVGLEAAFLPDGLTADRGLLVGLKAE